MPSRPSRPQRLRVWRGELKKTSGGLTRDDLVKNSKGKIVSRRKSKQAGEQNNLGVWLRSKGDKFGDKPAKAAAPNKQQPKQAQEKPKVKPKPEPRGPGRASLPGRPAKQPAPKPRPKPLKAPKPVKAPKVLKAKQKKQKVVLHAREPQPEFVKFKEDLGKSSLKVAKEPDLYAVRRDPIVESAPVARNVNPKFSDVSVSNIRRRSSRRKKKRVDYSKFF